MKKKAKKTAKPVTHTKKVVNVVKKNKGITPLLDRVVLRPLTADEVNTTISGIIIPDTVHKDKPEQGIIMAVGEGRWDNGKRIPIGVNVGDRVVFSRYGYDEVKLEGEEYYILKEENILAIIDTK